MRYFFLILTALSAAVLAGAQDVVPQGPSSLSAGTYDTVTRPGPAGSAAKETIAPSPLQMQSGEDKGVVPTILLPGAVLPKIPIESEKMGIGISSAAANLAPQPGQVEETNAVNSSKVSFLMNAGVQYEDEGEYADAEQAYLRALEKAPGNPDIRFRLSTLYIQMKRYPEAVKTLEALSSEFPDNAMVHNNLAWIYATGGEMKNGKMALLHAREALLETPYAPSIWNTLAEAYYVSGQYDNALRSSDQALDLLSLQKPSDAEIAAFKEQNTKIQRATDASKIMLDFAAGK